MTGDDGRGRTARRASRPSTGPSGAEFAGVGLQFGGTLALFAFVGHWLDGRLGTSPWLLLVLVFVGAGAAFYSIYRRVIGPGRRPPRDAADHGKANRSGPVS
ncbi:MAG TPA: AtpZ/AtpI family protein [Gemmatirosa sp.]